MAGYTKVFSTIWGGSLYGHFEASAVFLVFLSLADMNGTVDMTPEAIAGTTGWPLDFIQKGIRELESPDERSRTKGHEGRRIVLLDTHREWGWMITNYALYREKMRSIERREYLREAQRKHREKDSSTPVNTSTSVNQNKPITDTEASTDTKALRVRGRAIALPPDFELTDAQVAYARGKGILDVPRELEAFKAHHLAHGKVMKDWGAAWRTWCLNFEKFGGKSSGKESRKLSATERVRQRSRSRIAEIDAELAQREADAGTVDPDGGHLRLPMGESVRGSR